MAENGDLESAEPMEQTEVKTETKTEGEEEERTEDYQKLVDYGISEKVANELDEIYKSGEYQLMLSVSEHIAFEEMNILCVTSWSFEALCHLACRYICAFLQWNYSCTCKQVTSDNIHPTVLDTFSFQVFYHTVT